MPNLKPIDVDKLFKAGLNYSASTDTLTPVVARNWFIYNQKLTGYNSFARVATTSAPVVKIYDNGDDVVAILADGDILVNWTAPLAIPGDDLIDVVYFYGYWYFLSSLGTRILRTNDFIFYTTINLPTDIVATNLTRDLFRLIVYNKDNGVVRWSGFQNGADWTDNAPGETLHGFKQVVEPPVVGIHQTVKDTIITTKHTVYQKVGDYPYELYNQKLQANVELSVEVNNKVFLITDETIATLRQTAAYGDFEHVPYIDSKINSYKELIAEPIKADNFHTGFLIKGTASNLYYDVLTDTFWEINPGLDYIPGITKEDYWQDSSNNVYKWEFGAEDYTATAEIETSELPINHICKILSYSVESPQNQTVYFKCSNKRIALNLEGGCPYLNALCSTLLTDACSINILTIGRNTKRKYVRVRGTLNLSFSILANKALKVHNFTVFGQPA